MKFVNQRVLALHICFYLQSVWLLGVEVTCPEIFKDGMNTVICRINTTAVREAECIPQEYSVTFDLTFNSASSTLYFLTQAFNSTACNRWSTSEENTCWCSRYEGEIFEYSFVYKADSSMDAGAQLECKICFSTVHPLDVNNNENCGNLTFAGKPDSEDTSSVGPIVGFIITAFLLLVISASVLLFLRHRQKRSAVKPSVCRHKAIENYNCDS